METEQSLQYPSSSTSLPPPENPFESFLGSLVTLISRIEIRYEGILYYINPVDATLGLHTVICHGTEGRINNYNNGLQIPPINEVFHYITFCGNHIKEMLVSTNCGYYYKFGLTKEATTTTTTTTSSSNKPSYHAGKPPRPGGKIRQKKIPLVYSEKFIQDSTFDDNRLELAQNYDHWSYLDYYNQAMMTNYEVPNNQALINTTHTTSSSAINPTHSFFTTFPPGPISLRQVPLGLDFGVMNQNFTQYQLWEPTKEDTTNIDESFNAILEPEEEDTTKPIYNLEGSSYTISRMPFDPIGRFYNPFGPIARPVNSSKEINSNLQWRYQLQELPQCNFRGGYINNYNMLF